MALIRLTFASTAEEVLVNSDEISTAKATRNGTTDIHLKSGVVMTVREDIQEIDRRARLS
jgi:hypothetical protein